MGGFEGKGERGSRRVGGARGIESGSLWLAPNLSKRWGEIFFLLYTPFWLTLCLGIIVPYKLYEGLIMSWEATEFVISIFGDGEERVIGKASAVPTEIGAKRVVELGVGDFSIGVEAKLVGFDCGGVDPDAADVGTNLEDEDAGAPSWQRGERSGNR